MTASYNKQVFSLIRLTYTFAISAFGFEFSFTD